MATTPAATSDLSVKSENVIYERYSKQTFSDTDPKKLIDTKVVILSNPKQEEKDELLKDGYTLEFTQTVRVDKAGTIEGMSQIISDKEELVVIFNRGLQSKLNQKLNSKFRENKEDGSAEWQATDDVYDPSELLNDPTQRKSLSPLEKAFKGLEKSGISADMLAAAMAALKSAQSGSAAMQQEVAAE
jgi:hypothetical protein